MAQVTRSQIINFLWPGLALIVCDHKYWDSIYKKVFKVMPSKKAFEIVPEFATTGYAEQMNEGEPYTLQTNTIINRTEMFHTSFGVSIDYTFEAIDDNLYTDELVAAGEQIKYSLVTTRDVNATNVFNQGFSSTIGDGQPFFSASHPTLGSTYSNLAVPGTFSEETLTGMITQAQTLPDAANKVLNYQAEGMMCAPALQYDMARVLFNAERPGTANRDIGVIKTQGYLKNGFIPNPYLTNNNAFFMFTSCPNALVFFERNMAEVSKWMEDKIRVVGMGGFDRYSAGPLNARGCIGAQGF